jgi:hypothetical protein
MGDDREIPDKLGVKCHRTRILLEPIRAGYFRFGATGLRADCRLNDQN